ncbi:MAG: efflux RND transporter periplasmic adaptor subunit [Maricaulis sp.]|jgi:RND family efflux transporter MFP subunit|nr:efflux RND transporter periplasmic adaptor subunit [Maricaulis sp.]MDG2044181.1 efflux RND transporter periplasmic adaptor subunit [Maricaulis sp.]
MSVFGRRMGAGSAVAFASLLIAILVFGVSTLRAEATFQSAPPLPIPVSTIEADYSPAASIEEMFPGLVSARRESALGFERGGRIETVEVDVGDRVIAGQILARLDTRAVEAQIAAADAQTAETAARTALALGTEERQAQLLARGHISQQRFDEVRTSTRAARAQQNAAAAAADALRVHLDLSIITAPFDAVVTARRADEGAIAAPGSALIDIIESDALEIRVGLPPVLAGNLVTGQSYRFVGDGSVLNARFRASTGVVDRQSRAVTAIFDLDAGSRVAIGQVVRLAVETPIATDGFWVPITALAEGRRGLWSVYVLSPIDSGYRLESRMVETVRVEAERAFVRGAVSDGSLILAAGLQRITPGQLVEPVSAEARVR